MVTALRKEAKKVSTTIETITPEVAGDWLAKNRRNRELRDHKVKRLADIMRRGEWQDCNGETIKFGTNGALLDGQHRLAAAIMSNSTIRSLVAWDIDPESFRTIDTGSARSIRDALFLIGEEGQNDVALALNALWRWLRFQRFLYYHAPSNSELLDVLEQHPGIRYSASVGKQLHNKLPSASKGVFGALHYVFTMINQEDAVEFFGALREGTNLQSNDPIYVLRELLKQPAPKGGFKMHDDIAARAIKAWNAWRDGKSVERLFWRPSVEPYPVPH